MPVLTRSFPSISDLRKLGGDFVFGYIQAIDGEKDPRNLMAIFGLTPIVIKNFDLGRFVEVGYVL